MLRKLKPWLLGTFCGLIVVTGLIFCWNLIDAPDELIIDDSNYVQIDKESVDLYNSFAKEKVTVVRVIDGDTYVVMDEAGTEITIRLIGIDTPESVAPDEYLLDSGKENSEFGKTVSEIMKEKLPERTTIYIQRGEDDTDKYG